MSPKLILFDCDGTLVHSHQYIIQAMQQAIATHGLDVPSEQLVAGIIGLSLRAAVRELLPYADDAVVHAVIDAYRTHYRRLEQDVVLYDGVEDTLHTLQLRGYWLGVVTGKSRSGLLRVLEQFDLMKYFMVWRTADCCPSKPNPAMALECMHELGVSAAQTIVVGDAVFDMQLAQSAGVTSIGVSFGVGASQDLHAAGAFSVVDTFSDLLQHFPKLEEEICS